MYVALFSVLAPLRENPAKGKYRKQLLALCMQELAGNHPSSCKSMHCSYRWPYSRWPNCCSQQQMCEVASANVAEPLLDLSCHHAPRPVLACPLLDLSEVRVFVLKLACRSQPFQFRLPSSLLLHRPLPGTWYRFSHLR